MQRDENKNSNDVSSESSESRSEIPDNKNEFSNNLDDYIDEIIKDNIENICQTNQFQDLQNKMNEAVDAVAASEEERQNMLDGFDEVKKYTENYQIPEGENNPFVDNLMHQIIPSLLEEFKNTMTTGGKFDIMQLITSTVDKMKPSFDKYMKEDDSSDGSESGDESGDECSSCSESSDDEEDLDLPVD